MTEHLCIDCLAEPGGPQHAPRKLDTEKPPRCYTHQRALLTRQRKQSRARQVERTYGISDEDNHALFLLQGGRCWLCRKATGATKSLAVDHDHATNEVRGRLCGPCNQFIGKLGDDPEAARRLVAYLAGDTPYRRLKAQQTLRAVQASEGEIVIMAVYEMGGELWADWYLHRDGEQATSWFRNLVRRDDGVWSVTRD